MAKPNANANTRCVCGSGVDWPGLMVRLGDGGGEEETLDEEQHAALTGARSRGNLKHMYVMRIHTIYADANTCAALRSSVYHY